MTPEQVAALVARWVRVYTRRLPGSIAQRRVEEIDADVHDHIGHERSGGTADRRIALSLLSRMARGLAADLSWRVRQGRAARTRTSLRTYARGAAMGHSRTAAATLFLAAVIAGLVWLFSGFLFRPELRDPHPLAIVVWLVFGGGLTAVSRAAPRPVALGAAALLGLVAAVDLVTPFLQARGGLTGLISSSEYTWIAIAILTVNGAFPERSPSRRAPESSTKAPARG